MLFKIAVLLFKSDWNLKRLCNETKNPTLKKILIAIYDMHQYENGSAIAWNSVMAGRPCYPHGIKSIFISGGATIGRNCVIFQQVTIGSNTLADSNSRGVPIIGDNCYIGAGAKIVGRLRIGNNVRIGANVVVYKDVPDNSVVLSGEQRVVSRTSAMDNRYYSLSGRWVFFDDGAWKPVTDEATIRALTEMPPLDPPVELEI